MLNNREISRYSRHISLDNIGIDGQLKLKKAKVLVIGAGGLGCPVLQYLTAAGIGNIGIIDFDTIEESNLQRQILFSTIDTGSYKAEIAAQKLVLLNPLVKFDVYIEKLTTHNALELFNKYDIIVDGTDNFSTRYLVNDACILSSKPLVYGAIHRYEGQVSVFNYKSGPTYRCLFPEPPKPGSIPNCSELGVIGVLPGIIGCYQANEVLKIILEIGNVLSGLVLVNNLMNNQSYTLNIKRNEDEIEKVLNNIENFKTFNYDIFCGVPQSSEIKNINLEEFKIKIRNDNTLVLDVRESWEEPKLNNHSTINIPLNQIENRFEELDNNKEIIVFCQHGVRSIDCINILKNHGFDNLINLKEGIQKWQN